MLSGSKRWGSRMTNKLWVVEMEKQTVPRTWVTTVGVGVTLKAGREELRRWQQNNPDDTFRLNCYEPAEWFALGNLFAPVRRSGHMNSP